MPLASGARIGGYEVLSLLGAGGMGEVYRARDARLGRDVAIKVLSPDIAADADGLMRFEREARMLASLNHPNIAAIYGVEEFGGQPALILEIVEGETLADRIARGPVSVRDALDVARQLTEALDAAHESGIVHRDLKPGNIKITADGRVKVLDFGLAKAIAAAGAAETAVDPASSPTITVKGTKHGVILGTAAYMSPEQARGKTIDKRTDIWAFGCVLFEMLTGRRAFDGDTTSDVIAAILERQPDLARLPSTVPADVRRVIERCLEKDRKQRVRDIADVRAELDRPAASAPARPRRSMAALAAAACAIVVGLLGVASWRWYPAATPEPDPAIEFTFAAPPDHTLAALPATVSPDGHLIAFSARDSKQVPSLWIRPLDGTAARRLEGTEGVGSAGHWSPDGRSLVFLVGTTWKRIAVDGGPTMTVAADVINNLGASWGAGDTIVFAQANRTALSRVHASGGAPAPVTTLDPDRENSHRWPHMLPDGRHFLFTARSDRPDNLGIRLGDLESAAVRPLVNVASPGVYADPGWLLFVTPDEVLMAQRFNPATWLLEGVPQPAAAAVRYNGPSASGIFHASRDGRVLVYAPPVRERGALFWVDRSGKTLGPIGPRARYRSVRVSPDGSHVAVELASERYGTRDIWLVDTATNALTQLTSHAATDWRPVFSRDGKSVAFASDRAGLSTVFRVAINAAGAESLVYRHAAGGAFPHDWPGDGKAILVSVDDGAGRSTAILSVPLDGAAPTPLVQEPSAPVNMASLSPSGDRMVFTVGGSLDRQVYLASLADRQRVRISVDGGLNPVWGPDGRELFFQNTSGDVMRAVLSRTGLALEAPPALLFRPCEDVGLRFSLDPNETNFSVTADGRFVVRCDPQETVPSAMTVVVNWQSRLR